MKPRRLPGGCDHCGLGGRLSAGTPQDLKLAHGGFSLATELLEYANK